MNSEPEQNQDKNQKSNSPANCSADDTDGDDEALACFNRDDLPKIHTGKLSSIVFPMLRSKAHESKTPHIIARIYAFSTRGTFLVQKRSLTRRSHPGLYTDSASGHIKYHPNFDYEFIQQEAWRELKEEMDATVIYGRLFDINLEEFRSGGCELAYNFVALVNEQIHPNLTETASESGFKTIEELRLLLETQEFVPITKKYWIQFIHQIFWQKLLEEYQSHVQINQNLDSFQVTHVALWKEEDQEGTPSTVALSDSDRMYNYSPDYTVESQLKIGALVGRFQPFHNGHLLLVLEILRRYSFVKIGIGSVQYHHTQENPFTYEERAEMITNTLKENNISLDRFQIYPIPDFHDIVRWTHEVIRILGEFDAFFSNNEWTRQLMLNAGKPIAALFKFEFDRFNGTNIRKRICKGGSISDLIPPAVEICLTKIDGFQRIRSLINCSDLK